MQNGYRAELGGPSRADEHPATTKDAPQPLPSNLPQQVQAPKLSGGGKVLLVDHNAQEVVAPYDGGSFDRCRRFGAGRRDVGRALAKCLAALFQRPC
jgi:hypothetical protein